MEPSSGFEQGRTGAVEPPPAHVRGARADVLVYALAAALVTLISVVDFYSGPDLSFSLFYFAIVAALAWRIGLAASACVAAVTTALVWFAVDWFALDAPSRGVLLWNAGMRLGVLVAVGVIVARLRVALDNERRLARTDHLTQVFNARAFAERARLELSRAARTRHALTVAYVDVDDFKLVNDRFGHSRGDDVLRTIASVLKASLRATDCVARVGGDEFVVLLPETDREHAGAMLSRLHDAISAAMAGSDLVVTFSIGAVVFDEPPDEVDALIRASDRVMYEAKASGKNRLHFGARRKPAA